MGPPPASGKMPRKPAGAHKNGNGELFGAISVEMSSWTKSVLAT